jgi:transposase
LGGVKRARGAKSDRIDAVRAARQALSSEHQATPRARGLREALRLVLRTRQALLVSRTKAINELKSVIVTAPEHLRAGLRGVSLANQLNRVETLVSPDSAGVEHRVTVLTLRGIASRIRFLSAQISELDPELMSLVKAHPAGPTLLAEPGVGPVVAAQLFISWSHRGRVRNEAAFAALAGTAPLEASSGQRSRHRLNRGGDRDLNRALHTVAITRLRCHPETIRYETRRTAEGKTHRDIRRAIKRTLARSLYRQIQAATQLEAPPIAA